MILKQIKYAIFIKYLIDLYEMSMYNKEYYSDRMFFINKRSYWA